MKVRTCGNCKYKVNSPFGAVGTAVCIFGGQVTRWWSWNPLNEKGCEHHEFKTYKKNKQNEKELLKLYTL